ncbi:MAG: hypothetical protein ACI4T8_00670 [Christensenellales bacterium]
MKKFFYALTCISFLGGVALELLSVFGVVPLTGYYLKAFYTCIIIFIPSLFAINSSSLIEEQSVVGGIGIALVYFATVPILEIIWLDMAFNSGYGYIVFANALVAVLVNTIIAFSFQLKKRGILIQIMGYVSCIIACGYGGLRLYGPAEYYNSKIVIIAFIAGCLLYLTALILLNCLVRKEDGGGGGAKPKKEKKSKPSKKENEPSGTAEIDPSIGAGGGPPIAF